MILLLCACVSAPTFDTGGVDRTLTPQGIAAEPQKVAGKYVLWGGVIQGITQLQDGTQIEVLAYPLDADGQPLSHRESWGHFILERPGHLEPASYANGRLITVVGRVTGSRAGDPDHDYPTVSARQLHLWPPDRRRLGTGSYIGIGAGGSGGVGIGIGF